MLKMKRFTPSTSVLDSSTLTITTADLYCAKYVPIRCRTLSPEEIIIRRTARDLKVPILRAIETAAPAMAVLIDTPCWLVPVPASNGS